MHIKLISYDRTRQPLTKFGRHLATIIEQNSGDENLSIIAAENYVVVLADYSYRVCHYYNTKKPLQTSFETA